MFGLIITNLRLLFAYLFRLVMMVVGGVTDGRIKQIMKF